VGQLREQRKSWYHWYRDFCFYDISHFNCLSIVRFL